MFVPTTKMLMEISRAIPAELLILARVTQMQIRTENAINVKQITPAPVMRIQPEAVSAIYATQSLYASTLMQITTAHAISARLISPAQLTRITMETENVTSARVSSFATLIRMQMPMQRAIFAERAMLVPVISMRMKTVHAMSAVHSAVRLIA